MKTVYIEWQDSCSLAGNVWHDNNRHASTSLCKTTGFIIHEDQNSITIASHIDSNKHMAGDITIPKRAITKRRILRWKK